MYSFLIAFWWNCHKSRSQSEIYLCEKMRSETETKERVYLYTFFAETNVFGQGERKGQGSQVAFLFCWPYMWQERELASRPCSSWLGGCVPWHIWATLLSEVRPKKQKCVFVFRNWPPTHPQTCEGPWHPGLSHLHYVGQNWRFFLSKLELRVPMIKRLFWVTPTCRCPNQKTGSGSESWSSGVRFMDQ